MAHLTTSKTMSSNLKSNFKSIRKKWCEQKKRNQKELRKSISFPKNIYIHGNSNEAISDNILKHKYFWCKTMYFCALHMHFSPNILQVGNVK